MINIIVFIIVRIICFLHVCLSSCLFIIIIIIIIISRVSKRHNGIGCQFIWVWQIVSWNFLQNGAFYIKNALKFIDGYL